MKNGWIVLAALVAVSGLIVADPALARSKHKAQRQCFDQPQHFTWGGIFTNPAPLPNGCAPPVYASGGRYTGQDPDPFIRQELRRDPRTGFSPY